MPDEIDFDDKDLEDRFMEANQVSQAEAYEKLSREKHALWVENNEWAVTCGRLVKRAEAAEADRDEAEKDAAEYSVQITRLQLQLEMYKKLSGMK